VCVCEYVCVCVCVRVRACVRGETDRRTRQDSHTDRQQEMCNECNVCREGASEAVTPSPGPRMVKMSLLTSNTINISQCGGAEPL
jgi:hypothetical protein